MHIRARKHGHLYWIPLIPMGEPLEYVECTSCHSTWQPSVLDAAPADDTAVRDLLGAAILATAVSVAAADGQVDDAEVDVVCGVVEQVTGTRPDRAAVQRLAANAGAEDLETAESLLRTLEPALQPEGKEMIIAAALAVSVADGHLEEGEGEVVGRIAGALGVSATHLKGIVASFMHGSNA